MAGIGKEEYPEIILSEAISVTERVGRENVKTAMGLAVVMGLKNPSSGYFYHRVSGLTKYYGLLDRSRGGVSLTPLGERIAHPLSDQDKRAAEAEAASKVTLLRSLYDQLGPNFHDADFRTKLRDVTQASLQDIEQIAPYIEKLYRDALQFLTPASVAPRGPSSARPERNLEGEGAPRELESPHRYEPGYRTFEGDGVFLKIKKDREALEEALATIQGWLKRHGSGEGKTDQPTAG